jgi:hypothetical protein
MSWTKLISAPIAALALTTACLISGCSNPSNSLSNPAKTPTPTDPAPAVPSLTWKSPAAVAVGAVLGSAQLNAKASVAGKYAYSPAAGTTLDSAGKTMLSVTFTPTDSEHYSTATGSVSLTVNAAAEPPTTPPTAPPPTSPPAAAPTTSSATPTFSPAPGKFTTTQQVKLSTATAGATIYYTTDGSAPTTSSTPYDGAIAVSATMTIEAIAVTPNLSNSGLGRGDYVIQKASAKGPQIPEDAIAVTDIQTFSNWKYKHDTGTKGSSDGSMKLVEDPAQSGQSAKFETSFENWGGERYSSTWANDSEATHFVYDTQVWINEGSKLGNLEMDNNQALSNGDLIIFAFQCAGDSKTWDYSENAGTPKHPDVKWLHSKQPCNPASWTTNEWHHVQISYSRDDSGNVTYESVWLDGVEAPINETVPGAFALDWAKGTLKTNFQVDGIAGSGSSTLYADNMTFYRW